MAYAQVHTAALRHPKVVSLSDGAFRLWVAGLAFCQEHLTDGVLLPQVVHQQVLGVKVSPARVEELVRARLWDVTAAPGWIVHDYLDWNECRHKVLDRREKAKQRMDKTRGRSHDVRANNSRSSHAVREPIRNATIRNDTQRSDTPPPGVVGGSGWTMGDAWERWRELATAHGARTTLGTNATEREHLRELTESFTSSELERAMVAWWASPHTGGRSLGLFRAQIGEVFEWLAKYPALVFRAPDRERARAVAEVDSADYVARREAKKRAEAEARAVHS